MSPDMPRVTVDFSATKLGNSTPTEDATDLGSRLAISGGF